VDRYYVKIIVAGRELPSSLYAEMPRLQTLIIDKFLSGGTLKLKLKR
jgi:hypothetical protein